ncbi:MAG: hypothetical protein C4547_11045 [Phycisphaerales bacterium]|nr:MAG: hypothetical protein C4547_11045 [Phycisphaerales bacterium]
MATTTCQIPKLESLIDYLDSLTHRASVADLRRELEALDDLTVEDVAEYVRFDERQYLRNLIKGGPWYHLLALCWRSGQRSPIHNHAQSTCGVRVLKGKLTETQFRKTPCGQIAAVGSEDMGVGEVCAMQDAYIHQISNLQAPGQDLITLHIYSPPLLRMDTYSLTDPTVGQYYPVILEHCEGSGI